MQKYRFDGRVAIVTGAGRGLGRAHALLLAERGACVVVNDLGSSVEGDGSDPGPASGVAGEILDAGGRSLANASDVSTPDGASELVDTAIGHFGRVDIIVNNAGIMQWAGLPEVDEKNLERHLSVHLFGSFNTVRAAWPHFVRQGYGRVVMTTSTGIFGLADNLSYAAAKSAVIGLTRSLAVAGSRYGIKANLVAPAAFTRMASRAPGREDEPRTSGSDGLAALMPPEAVAPLVAYLAHEDCPVTGEIYAAGAGRFARIFIASTPGFVHADVGPPTVEDVANHWATINDETGYYVPADLESWTAAFMAHLAPSSR